MSNITDLFIEEDVETRKLNEAFKKCELADMFYITMGFIYSVKAYMRQKKDKLKEKIQPLLQRIKYDKKDKKYQD